MKKKIISVFVLTSSIISLFIFVQSANANTMLTSEIPNNSYVIGTHIFTSDMVLTTKHIMLASKTIEGNMLDDMIIYYKSPKGVWVDGLTGKKVNMPNKIKITNINLENVNVPETPTLSNDYGTENIANLSILAEGYYGNPSNLTSINGWELYEKTDEEYVKVTESGETPYSYSITDIDYGFKKIYVARVYTLDSNNQKKYSEYSNEIVIERKVETPTLSNDYGTRNVANLSILAEGYYGNPSNLTSINGWELYEKTDEEYVKVTESGEPPYSYNIIDIDYGFKKTYVARVYALDSSNQKKYSDYSNEIVIERRPETPTLASHGGSPHERYIGVIGWGVYEESESWSVLSGWELYEKINDDYELIKDVNSISYANDVGISKIFELNTNKIFVARVYVLDSNNRKIYSDYSNEYIVSSVQISAPTLTLVSDESNNYKLNINSKSPYSDEHMISFVSGWELYEKSNTEYIKVNESDKNSYSYDITDSDFNKIYVARVYALDTNGKKLYSEYSNEIVVEK